MLLPQIKTAKPPTTDGQQKWMLDTMGPNKEIIKKYWAVAVRSLPEKSWGLCTLSPKFVSEMFARKKINMTSRYVPGTYTLPPKHLSFNKKFGLGSFFASIASILRVFWAIQSHRILRLMIEKKLSVQGPLLLKVIFTALQCITK